MLSFLSDSDKQNQKAYHIKFMSMYYSDQQNIMVLYKIEGIMIMYGTM